MLINSPSNCRYIFVALVMAYLRCDRKSIFLSIITPRTLASSLKTRSCPLMLMAGIGTGRIFLEIGTTVVFSDAKVNLFSSLSSVSTVSCGPLLSEKVLAGTIFGFSRAGTCILTQWLSVAKFPGGQSSKTSRAKLVTVLRCPGGVPFEQNLTSEASDGFAMSRRCRPDGSRASTIGTLPDTWLG
ncbi:hypothetical protein DERF_014013 [Dermatophagoides farinae]|uniref:Uncharacterized protein n=1 Tax=Dermatophagoides farinae TaxID=6954 RepID=A0A922L2X8_DERFA|nr:hypothetical protein DERF_014013 [Dermatophagoides farinae]